MNTTLRLGVIGAVFFALLGILTLRLWTMQVTEVRAYEERAQNNQIRVVGRKHGIENGHVVPGLPHSRRHVQDAQRDIGRHQLRLDGIPA